MKLEKLNPSYDEIIYGDRVLYGGGDVWKEDNDGILHQHISNDGRLLTIKVPSNIPMKYKGKKLCRLNVFCNACELVTGIEAFYSLPAICGYALAFRNPETSTFDDVSDQFK